MDRNNAGCIGARIKAQREAHGLTQGELAKQLFVKRETVNQWESETRQIKDGHIARLADVLNTSCDYLLGRTDTPTTDADERACCDYTGLSKEAVDWLHTAKSSEFAYLLDVINALFADNQENDFAYLLYNSLYRYATSQYSNIAVYDVVHNERDGRISSTDSKLVNKFIATENISTVLEYLWRTFDADTQKKADTIRQEYFRKREISDDGQHKTDN